MNLPFRLSVLIAALMAAQSLSGLVRPDLYRDVAWIRATWFGNDAVTLAIAVPLLLGAVRSARRGSARGLLLWLGLLGYGAYNYAYYLLGAALNVFLPLYIVLFVLCVSTLVLALAGLDTAAVAAAFGPRTPARPVGGYLVFVAVGLACVWMGMWAAHVFAGKPTPVEPEAFKLVAALDCALMVPALALGGVLLWKRRAWGCVIATIAAVQGALYLFVLSVNSGIAIRRGLAEAPGELPVWGTLCVTTGIAALLLLKSADGRAPGPARGG